jgi:hypothetical protein
MAEACEYSCSMCVTMRVCCDLGEPLFLTEVGLLVDACVSTKCSSSSFYVFIVVHGTVQTCSMQAKLKTSCSCSLGLSSNAVLCCVIHLDRLTFASALDRRTLRPKYLAEFSGWRFGSTRLWMLQHYLHSLVSVLLPCFYV